jgi:hypothetical protein
VDSKGGYVRVVVRWDTFQVWLWGSHCLSRWQVCSAILVPARLRYCLCLIARAPLLRGTRDRRDFAVAIWKKVPKITSLARSYLCTRHWQPYQAFSFVLSISRGHKS